MRVNRRSGDIPEHWRNQVDCLERRPGVPSNASPYARLSHLRLSQPETVNLLLAVALDFVHDQRHEDGGVAHNHGRGPFESFV
jgi:hypothetical protein